MAQLISVIIGTFGLTLFQVLRTSFLWVASRHMFWPFVMQPVVSMSVWTEGSNYVVKLSESFQALSRYLMTPNYWKFFLTWWEKDYRLNCGKRHQDWPRRRDIIMNSQAIYVYSFSFLFSQPNTMDFHRKSLEIRRRKAKKKLKSVLRKIDAADQTLMNSLDTSSSTMPCNYFMKSISCWCQGESCMHYHLFHERMLQKVIIPNCRWQWDVRVNGHNVILC